VTARSKRCRALTAAALIFIIGACSGNPDSSTETLDSTTASTEHPVTTTPSTTDVGPATTDAGPATTAEGLIEVREVLVVGDSLSRGLFPPLAAAFEGGTTSCAFELCVGFIAPESRAKWEEIFAENPPDIVVVLLATWENIVLRGNEVIDTNQPGWQEKYQREIIDPWIELASGSGSHVVWIAMPQTGEPERSAQHQELNALWSEAAKNEPTISWVDGATILAGPDGGYVEIDRSVEPPIRLFNIDGLHLCPGGAQRLAEPVLDLLREKFGLESNSGWQESGWASDTEAFVPQECPSVATD